MQVFLDYLPVIVFVAVFAVTKDILAATIGIMIAMPIMLVGHWLLTRKVNRLHLFSTILVLVLGAVTLYFKSSVFIAWKPTVLNWLLGVACFASLWIGEKPLMERFLASSVELTRSQWRQLTTAWAAFFMFLGAVNLYVYYNYTEAQWAYFKLWGLMGLTLIFAIAQAIWMSRWISANEAEQTQHNG